MRCWSLLGASRTWRKDGRPMGNGAGKERGAEPSRIGQKWLLHWGDRIKGLQCLVCIWSRSWKGGEQIEYGTAKGKNRRVKILVQRLTVKRGEKSSGWNT